MLNVYIQKEYSEHTELFYAIVTEFFDWWTAKCKVHKNRRASTESLYNPMVDIYSLKLDKFCMR